MPGRFPAHDFVHHRRRFLIRKVVSADELHRRFSNHLSLPQSNKIFKNPDAVRRQNRFRMELQSEHGIPPVLHRHDFPSSARAVTFKQSGMVSPTAAKEW